VNTNNIRHAFAMVIRDRKENRRLAGSKEPTGQLPGNLQVECMQGRAAQIGLCRVEATRPGSCRTNNEDEPRIPDVPRGWDPTS
jgi:hypothetical protein